MIVRVMELGKTLFDGEALRVAFPAIQGEACILPHHISLITSMNPGVIKIFLEEGKDPLRLEVKGGVASFSNEIASFMLYGDSD